MSVNKGETIAFKIKSATLELPHRHPPPRLLRRQRRAADRVGPRADEHRDAARNCLTFADTGLIDCGNWAVSRTWTVPSTAVSGRVHRAPQATRHRRRRATSRSSCATTRATRTVVLQTSDATWQAYNTYGGNSLYQCTTSRARPATPRGYKGAYKVSYNRPFNTAEDDAGRSALFSGGEYPMIRFLEAGGYNMSYVSSVDTHRRGALLQNHDLFISSGHDEYWSASQRTSMEAARDAGVNLAFFSGNERLLEDALGAEHRRLRQRRTARWSATRTRTSRPSRTRSSGRAHGVTRASRRRPTTSRRRTRSRASRSSSTPARRGSRCRTRTGKLRMWRNTAAATLPARRQCSSSRPRRSATSGTRTPTTASARRGSSGSRRRRSPGLEIFTDYGSTVTTGGTATHQPHDVPQAGRRPRVRRRHRAVVMGPRRPERRRQPRRTTTCSRPP